MDYNNEDHLFQLGSKLKEIQLENTTSQNLEKLSVSASRVLDPINKKMLFKLKTGMKNKVEKLQIKDKEVQKTGDEDMWSCFRASAEDCVDKESTSNCYCYLVESS